MQRLTWYAHRLRAMEPAEIEWRVRRVIGQRLPSRSFTDAQLVGPDLDWCGTLDRFRAAEGRPVLLGHEQADALAGTEIATATLVAADRVLDHRFAYFGYPEAALGPEIDWNHDPIGGIDWPALPGHRIDHRTAAGDPKWIWELNRLQHLPWLAQAWLLTGDDRYAAEAFDQLDSWIAANPPGRGIAWRGAFEAGIRAISVAVALQGLRHSPRLTVARFRAVVCMLAESARRCWAERSLYSSANNHLIGELAGLATVALLFPDLRPSPRWERDAVTALCAEADRQILPDGSGAEQAVGYQMFTAELLLLVAEMLRRRDGYAPVLLTNAITRSARYLAAVVGDHDPAPRYGDDDEGFALRLDASPVRTVRDHLGLVGAALGIPDAIRAGTRSPAAGWLDAPTKATEDVLRGEPFGSFHAPDGGLVVLRSGRRRITMDVGPLGYLSIAAHGHADALAVTLSADGHELVGHPGVTSYYGHPDWRSAHRGTRAHPTASVDGLDQSVIGGAFLWRQHARVHTHSVDTAAGFVDAEHDGYLRLDEPVVHRRWLIAPPDRVTAVVVDLFTGAGHHEFRTAWPLHPSLDVRPAGCGHLALREDAPALQLAYAASSGEPIRSEIRGDTDTNLGWWSHRLESRVPAWLVGSVVHAQTPVALVTTLTPGSAGEPALSGLAVALRDDAITVRWHDEDGAHLHTVLPSGDPPGHVRREDVADPVS
ncbi:alginate lyase family protein [Rhodococcus rhodochrous]|uniref:alginate lyase family protein n=1 Tax=Rhodococcus rhodochrous TaxID=1829 RepID=UPI001D00A615|nr:alginate lyase family protein [Rhodococcus rhodochrous]